MIPIIIRRFTDRSRHDNVAPSTVTRASRRLKKHGRRKKCYKRFFFLFSYDYDYYRERRTPAAEVKTPIFKRCAERKFEIRFSREIKDSFKILCAHARTHARTWTATARPSKRDGPPAPPPKKRGRPLKNRRTARKVCPSVPAETAISY